MTQPVVLVTSSILSDAGKAVLRDAGAEVIYMSGTATEDALLAQFAAANINGVLMRGSPPFTRRVLEAAPHLKIIAKHGAGVDSVDIDFATARGIVVANAGDANADPVAEQAIMFMLTLSRELPLLHRGLREGKWAKNNYQGREFRGRTVGIVGFGAIGKRTARMARALGANVVLYARSRIGDPEGMEVEGNFERLLGRVDILSLHCPLNDKTRGMLGNRELRLMKPTALVINTARGGLIDEAALIDALQSGRLGGAGLETFEQEPPDPKNPLIFLDNVICTPHVSALTVDAMARMGAIAAANIVGCIQRGECNPANVINPAVLVKK
jgi:D-3-phosphoglycerate dehydrogenase